MSPGAAAAFAQLAQQVSTLEDDYTDIKSTIVGLDRKFTDTLSSVATRFETALASVNAKLDERGRTQWPTLIAAGMFLLGVVGAVGAMALRPIDASTVRHEHRLDVVESRYITDLQRTIDALRNEVNVERARK